MDLLLSRPALYTVLLGGATAYAATVWVYARMVPDVDHGVWILAAAVAIPAMAATWAFVTYSPLGRLRRLTGRMVRLASMMDCRDPVRLQALLFESRQVSAEAVRVSRGMGDGEIYRTSLTMHAMMDGMFRAVSSGIRPTSDNVRAFQDQLRSLGRDMSDGMKSGRKDWR